MSQQEIARVPITSILETPGLRFSGLYRFRYPYFGIARNGNRYARCRLEDASGSVNAYAWDVMADVLLDVPDTALLQVQGISRIVKNQSAATIDRIGKIPNTSEFNAVDLIPPLLTPQAAWLPRLRTVIDSVQASSLKAFLNEVLTCHRIVIPFLTVPASANHHHSSVGGLLVHSIETAELVLSNGDLEGHERDLGVVAALFHDIGKIRCFMPHGKRSPIGYLLDHDSLTLRILDAPLQELEQTWADGALALQYLWTWNHSRTRVRYPLFRVAELVQFADRWSIQQDLKNRYLDQQSPSRRFARVDSYGPPTRLWRPAPPPDKSLRGFTNTLGRPKK